MLTLREELSKTHGIANDGSPFIIAEMSGNHNQSLDRALAIVDAAAQPMLLQTLQKLKG